MAEHYDNQILQRTQSMRDSWAFPSGKPQNTTTALRDDLGALYREMDIARDALALRTERDETYLPLVPLVRRLHERLKRIELILAKYLDEEGARDD
jgi:hypothetical protein